MAAFLTHCPQCGGEFKRGATKSDDFRGDGPTAGPVAGDPTLCGRCGLLLAFDAQQRVRAVTVEDMRLWAAQPGLLASMQRRQAELLRGLMLQLTRN